MLDAVVVILKREGAAKVTTNRIARVAGVSVGSVYQYFPDKRAIFGALHDRHAERIGRVVEHTLVEYAEAKPEALLRALVEALINAHAAEASLHDVLSQVPEGASGTRGLEVRLRGALRLALAPRFEPAMLERKLFVLTHVVESLAHGAVIARPSRLSLGAAREAAVNAVLACLEA